MNMNLLAHLFLTGSSSSEQMLGNFIADRVKGKAYLHYPIKVAHGILLHRRIDSFTDEHPIMLESKQLLHPYHGKWAGVVIDVLSDHFLATEWDRYSPNETLPRFVERVQRELKLEREKMGEKDRWIFDRMVRDEWLLGYEDPKGLKRAFEGLSKRTGNTELRKAVCTLTELDERLRSNFHSFFPELIRYVNELESHEPEETRPTPDR